MVKETRASLYMRVSGSILPSSPIVTTQTDAQFKFTPPPVSRMDEIHLVIFPDIVNRFGWLRGPYNAKKCVPYCTWQHRETTVSAEQKYELSGRVVPVEPASLEA